jgi:hypothetical protein
MLGSGQFGTPCERRHRAYLRMMFSADCTTAEGQSPVSSHTWIDPDEADSRCAQAVWAALKTELLTPNSCALPLGTAPVPASGSGNLGTSCERMQFE